MNKRGLCSLVVCMLAVCIVVSVLAQPAPIANITTANEETLVFDTGPSLLSISKHLGHTQRNDHALRDDIQRI